MRGSCVLAVRPWRGLGAEGGRAGEATVAFEVGVLAVRTEGLKLGIPSSPLRPSLGSVPRPVVLCSGSTRWSESMQQFPNKNHFQ